jgi:hypothetical protein
VAGTWKTAAINSEASFAQKMCAPEHKKPAVASDIDNRTAKIAEYSDANWMRSQALCGEIREFHECGRLGKSPKSTVR